MLASVFVNFNATTVTFHVQVSKNLNNIKLEYPINVKRKKIGLLTFLLNSKSISFALMMMLHLSGTVTTRSMGSVWSSLGDSDAKLVPWVRWTLWAVSPSIWQYSVQAELI